MGGSYCAESIRASRSSLLQTVARGLILAVGIFPAATRRQNVEMLISKYAAADLGRRYTKFVSVIMIPESYKVFLTL